MPKDSDQRSHSKSQNVILRLGCSLLAEDTVHDLRFCLGKLLLPPYQEQCEIELAI